MNSFPTLTTERLVLRALRPDDAEAALLFRGDPEVMKYDGPLIHTREEAVAFIEEVRRECEAGEARAWAAALREDGTAIGSVGLWEWNRYHRRAEVGYGIARAYWGQGYGAEAVGAAIQYGFQAMELHRIFARTIAENHRSVRMLERLGFTREGTQREHSWEDDGRFHDSAVYGLLQPEWRGA